MKFFYQNIYLCKNIVSVKYKRLETAKKFDPHSPVGPKTGKKKSYLAQNYKKASKLNFFG